MWHGTKKVWKHWLLQYFRLSDILATICSFNFNISQQKKKKQTNSRQPGLTWCDEAVLWFFFDLMVLLLVLVSFSFAASVCSCALRCDRSVDCVCRWLTFLQHQVHGLSGEKWVSWSDRSARSTLTCLSHLPRVSQSLDCLLMSGSLQTPAIHDQHSVTWI